MTVGELRDQIIADGIAEVARVYATDDPRRAGAIEGFEICRSLSTVEEFETVLRAREKREHRMRGDHNASGRAKKNLDAYWKHRYGTLQIEWVRNCLLVVWGGVPSVSARALMKVNQVMSGAQ